MVEGFGTPRVPVSTANGIELVSEDNAIDFVPGGCSHYRGGERDWWCFLAR